MLPLDDPRWADLTQTYHKVPLLVWWLDLLNKRIPKLGEALDEYDYDGELCHQGSICTATYATIPHLIDIVSRLPANSDERIWLFIFIGRCFACARRADAPAIPEYLQADWEAAKRIVIPLIAESLAYTNDGHIKYTGGNRFLDNGPRVASGVNHDPDYLRHLFAAIAAARSFPAFAFFLADFDNGTAWCPACETFNNLLEAEVKSHFLVTDRM